MLRSAKELYGYKIMATDGKVGKAYDFFFDDLDWTIRYLVVDTGSWLPGRKVIISSTVLGLPDWTVRIFPVHHTQQEIETSPPLDADKPVSRQMELRLIKHYNWPIYWGAGGVAEFAAAYAMLDALKKGEEKITEVSEGELNDSPHLRSAREVTGYQFQASNEKIGHLEDFILEDESWTIRYLVVDTCNWLPGGKKTLLSPSWIKRVDWAKALVYVRLTSKSIAEAPEYDPSRPIDRPYERRLHDYYRQPTYWI